MPADWNPDELPRAVGLLDAWLDSMRAPGGYSGPVSHWWDSCLVYTGPMLDWRYEGVVCGYLNLYRSTRDMRWLDKACRAADDVLSGQLADGHFHNSSFEHGPMSGGTPHEAAADIALLEVARILRENHASVWRSYFEAAQRNIQTLISTLWSGKGFVDQPDNPVLVANKNATMLEAFLLYQELGGPDMSAYIESAAQVILSAQVATGSRAGATVHRGTFKYGISFGIYTARCVGAISRLMESDPRPVYLDFIGRAVSYLLTLIHPQGSWLGHYAGGRRIAAPIWIAPSGELLRALLQARRWVDVPENGTEALTGSLIRAQTACGGIPTSRGLALRGALRPSTATPDFRDALSVVGWCDKAFRALSLLTSSVDRAAPGHVDISCQWRNRACTYLENDQAISLRAENGEMLYDWHKGALYPTIISLWP